MLWLRDFLFETHRGKGKHKCIEKITYMVDHENKGEDVRG